jgi:hypothetical protein
MVKIGRNELCKCNSGKKYKKCCGKKEIIPSYIPSEIINDITELMKEDYPDHDILDITNDIEKENYRDYQIKNYSSKVIMLAERNEKNKKFFAFKSNSEYDNFIVMYRGSYRIFNSYNFLSVYESIQKMIKTRLDGIEDK